MSLPNPDDYNSWQDYARALTSALGSGSTDVISGSNASATPPTIPGYNYLPDGFVPVWLDEDSANLYLGNPDFDPPDAPDLFMIDTGNLALAAVHLENMGPDSVSNIQIINATIGSVEIGNAAIITALIGDAQIVSAKISAASINTAHIADAQITSAKIANLAVGAAHIQSASISTAHIVDGSIVNAKIGNVIQSDDWNDMTKAGWRIKKDGTIEGRKLIIYDDAGNAIFQAGGTITIDRVFDAGALAALDSITLALVDDAGNLASLDDITLALVTDAGALAALNEVTAANLVAGIFSAANIGTYIQSGAIGTALIGNAAIVSALIANGTILNAHIGDAEITSAKIANLVVDKILSGQLDAEIEVGDGIFSFTVGSSTLYLGNGFGDSDQFFLWFGPSTVTTPADATEVEATVFLKVDGNAYFGGTLSAGILRNAYRSINTDTVESAVFGSLGGTRHYVVSYTNVHEMHRETGGAVTGTTEADLDLYVDTGSGYTLVESQHLTGGSVVHDAQNITDTIAGSFSFDDTSGGTDVQLKVEATPSYRAWAGSPPDVADFDNFTSDLSIVSTEE